MLRNVASNTAAISAALAALIATSVCDAGPGQSAEISLANDMVRDAVEAERTGHCADALDLLTQAIAIQPSADALAHQATCLVMTGKAGEALKSLARADELARKDKDKAALSLVAAKRATVRSELSQLTLKLPKNRTLQVLVDGELLADAEAKAPLLLDPGDHVVEAKLAGREPFRRTLTLERHQAGELDVASVFSETARGESPGRPTEEHSALPTISWVSAGAAASLLAGGTAAFVLAGTTSRAGATDCTTQPSCDSVARETVRRLDSAALALWALGALGIGVAVGSFYLDPSKRSGAPVDVSIASSVSSATVSLGGSF